MPAGGERACLRLAIAHDTRHEQVGIVKGSAESVGERITQFTALMNRTGRLRRDVARDAARKGKLLEQPFHPLLVLADVGIDFAVGALEIRIRHQSGSAVAGPGKVDHIQALFLDDPVQVNVDEVQSGRRAPVTEQARFDMRQLERLFQERIVVEVNLSDREVVRRAPPGINPARQVRGKNASNFLPRASPGPGGEVARRGPHCVPRRRGHARAGARGDLAARCLYGGQVEGRSHYFCFHEFNPFS